MTYKNTKTILFSSLIVAMVLPFSGMQSVDALHIGDEHSIYNYEERQQNLVNMLPIIEDRIDNARSDEVKESFELVKQRILAKLLDSSILENGAIELVGTFPSEPGEFEPNFVIEGIHLGCDDFPETWSYQGMMGPGETIIFIEQNFPDKFTNGTDENCDEMLWQDNMQLKIQPAFFGEGCYGDLVTSPTTSYVLSCGITTSGLWIVGITFAYHDYTETHYTYVNV